MLRQQIVPVQRMNPVIAYRQMGFPQVYQRQNPMFMYQQPARFY